MTNGPLMFKICAQRLKFYVVLRLWHFRLCMEWMIDKHGSHRFLENRRQHRHKEKNGSGKAAEKLNIVSLYSQKEMSIFSAYFFIQYADTKHFSQTVVN